MTALNPSDLWDLWNTGLKPQSPVAFDTETSGLYVDDGARVSTVSVAWVDYEGEWLDFANEKKEMTWSIEEFAPGEYAPIVSAAWPFDQGVVGKPEDTGQYTLWADAENLDREEWFVLAKWLYEVGGGDRFVYPDERLEAEQGLICHNALFDVLMMDAGCRRWPDLGINLLEQIAWDTQNVSHLLWPLMEDPRTGRPTTSLKPTSRVQFGVEVGDESDKVQKYLKKKKLPAGRWDLMPWDIVGPYADQDARLTIMKYLRQRWEIDNGVRGQWFGSVGTTYDRVHRRLATMKVLTRMEMRGLPYDEVESRLAADLCIERAKKIGDALPFNPDSEEAKKYYFDHGVTTRGVDCLDLPAYELTEKGNPSLTAEVLERMVADRVPFARELAEYNKATNAASMWYNGYADRMGADGRLRTRFRQNGTTSTRFSVERVNLQAIPQDYRLSSHAILEGIPTPRQLIKSAIDKMPGWTGWELDLAQAELRVAALFAGCDKMLQMIENGDDLHSYTTQELFSISEDHPDWFKMRQVGKRGNFSLGFGSGGDTFGKMIRKETGIDLMGGMADQIVRDWNALYPEFGRAIDRHSAVVAKRQRKYGEGWIDLQNGERRWFHKFEDTHKAFNQRVQGNLAQFGIDWMLWSDEFLRQQDLDRFNAGLILTIHDSQVLLLPDSEDGERMAKRCADAGVALWSEWFPGVSGGVDIKRFGEK